MMTSRADKRAGSKCACWRRFTGPRCWGERGVRCFDHRSLAAIKALEPTLAVAVLIAETTPVSPGLLARQAGADVYCPDYRFVDEELIRQAHAEGVRVIPWTVNDAADWRKLRDWGVDGITTDFPGLVPA